MPSTRPTSTRLRVADSLDRLPVTRTHLRVVVAVGLGLFFDMYEVFLAGTISSALKTQFGLGGPALSVLLGSAFLGMFLGAAFVARLADRIGRRRMFLLSLTWYSLWSLVGAVSPNAAFLVACRFLAGIGVGAEYPVSDTYLSDVLPARARGRLAAWAYTCSYLAVPAVGFLSLAIADKTPWGFDGWRWLLALGAIGAVLVLILRRGLPESPRWLEAVGRHREADAALAQFATARPLRRQPVEAVAAAGPESTGGSGAAGVGTGGALPTGALPTGALPIRALPISALRRAPYLGRLVMLGIFHLLQTFGYYGFGTLAVLVLAERGYTVQHSLLYTALSFLGYPLGSLLSIPLISRIERKYLVVGSVLTMAAVGLLFATADGPATVVVAGVAFTSVSNVFSNAYHVYQAEIFPTELRASATGWTYSLSRLTTGLMPFLLLPLLHDAGPAAVFAVVAGAMVIVAADVSLLGPRTSARSVEDLNPR
ncbi:MAG TPA: MFS transporter [Pseudonocardia sp.]|jgi:putative MFS transporter|nr:MFS transporter [Pseudonocardia sp.]